jgi:hypothetical protein
MCISILLLSRYPAWLKHTPSGVGSPDSGLGPLADRRQGWEFALTDGTGGCERNNKLETQTLASSALMHAKYRRDHDLRVCHGVLAYRPGWVVTTAKHFFGTLRQDTQRYSQG